MSSTLRTSVMRMSAASPPGTSPLPILQGTGVGPCVADPSYADPEMVANLAYGQPHSLLPYALQDGYTRDRVECDIPTIELANETLRATFLPGWGGRLWSLVHVPSGRELLHRNPILQPANLALRDAWFAGGVEWNLGATGHWPLTCAPLHAVRVERSDGVPVLRMYEFERMRRLVFQIDAWLPPGSPVLYVHVSIVNPGSETVPAYWWSNIAVPESPSVRVLAPATQAFHFDYGSALRRIPYADGYPGRASGAADFFFDIPSAQRRWIAALDDSGAGLVHTSTDLLRGRKLFQWGTGSGGTRWQEWLSGPGSRYLEIQAGLARTQLEHIPLPPHTTWTWLEAYGLLQSEGVHGPWESAVANADAALEAMLPRDAVEAEHAAAGSWLGAPPVETLHTGSGWGALERRAKALPAFPGMPFGDETLTAEQKPWLELVESGRLPVSDPPASPVTGPHWSALLEGHPRDWHALLHIGQLRYAEGDVSGARTAWLESAELALTPWSLRNLGESARLSGDAATAADLLVQAFHLAPRLAPRLGPLAVETLRILVAAGRAREALEIVSSLSPGLRESGRIRLLEARAALAAGDLERCGAVLGSGLVVADLREGEDSLDALWSEYHAARDGVPAAQAVRDHPLPAA